jgi:hypothetical protein
MTCLSSHGRVMWARRDDPNRPTTVVEKFRPFLLVLFWFFLRGQIIVIHLHIFYPKELL